VAPNPTLLNSTKSATVGLQGALLRTITTPGKNIQLRSLSASANRTYPAEWLTDDIVKNMTINIGLGPEKYLAQAAGYTKSYIEFGRT